MRPRTKKTRSKPIRHDLSFHDDLFASVDKMVISLESLTHYLSRRYSKIPNDTEIGVLGFIVEKMRVEFTHQVHEVEVQTEFAKNFVTILAPKVEEESLTQTNERRIQLLKDFLPTMKEAQIRATLQLYRTLSPEAQEQLIHLYQKGGTSQCP